MKLIKYLVLVVIFTGCSVNQMAITFKSTTKQDFDSFVTTTEKKLIKCYYREDEEYSLLLPIDIIREDYYNPRYSKLKLVYPTIKNLKAWPYPYLNVIYIIKKEKESEIIVSEITNSAGLPSIKKFLSNNMECK